MRTTSEIPIQRARRDARAGRTLRGGERGAVFVEAIIVAVALTLLLAGVLFFHHLYSAKLFTLRESRRAAWNEALAGCHGAVLGNAGELVNAIWALPADVCSDVKGHECENGSILGFSMGYDAGKPTWSVPGGPRVGSSSEGVTASTPITWHGSVATNLTLACNEIPEEAKKGTVIDVVSYTAGLFFPVPF